MKFGIRTLSAMAAILALIAAGLSYWAGEQISMAGKKGGDAREATFQSYRIAQSLKSLAAGYELTMNEFYSTVLEFPAYQKKSAAQKTAIERELAALATLQEGGAATAAELTRLYKEMDSFRLGLEGAMTSTDKDWDRAREALFKLNVLSVQAIHQADLLGQGAGERATAMDMGWQAHQSQALLLLRIAAILALVTGGVMLAGALRLGRAPA
ncbi:MAG: hypothetical protein A2Z44_11200 [Betaproteobacteria bacterium RBG_19FT_COMBO_58_11]|nr:MAG: hypothetical protein A2Z44_11200 [Betaproteobacteria bacterium RBG_19FT_COMBO_58_11]